MRALCFVCVAVVLAGCAGGVKPKEEGTAGRPAREKLRTREEFKAAVIGRNTEDVLKLLGKPAQTREGIGSYVHWVYAGVSYDSVTDTLDPSTTILFDGEGVATGVVF